MQALISPTEVDSILSEVIHMATADKVRLDSAIGRILREPIIADRPFPPFHRVMMDGYAFRYGDLDQTDTFKIAHTTSAGEPPPETLNKGSCVEIMTGAVLPPEADCVIPYEECIPNLVKKEVQFLNTAQIEQGDFIHRAGSDQKSGETLLTPGCSMRSREIAIAATCGYNNLCVSNIPRIGVVSTGNELVEPNQTPKAYQIRKSNDLSIQAALESLHPCFCKRIHLPDDYAAVQEGLATIISTSDFVIITGGISKGKKDYIPEVLNNLNAHRHFHGVAQKPGKPFGFWSANKTHIFALPGNPLSTLVCLHRYVIPSFQRFLGLESTPMPRLKLKKVPTPLAKLTLFLPALLDLKSSESIAQPAQNSGDLVSILQTDGFVEIPAANQSIEQPYNFPFYAWH